MKYDDGNNTGINKKGLLIVSSSIGLMIALLGLIAVGNIIADKIRTARREEQERIAVEKYFESKVSKEFLSKKILDIEKSRVWEDIDYNSYRLVYERSSFKACTHPKKYPGVRVYKKYWRVGDEKLDALSDGFQHLRRDKAVFVTDIPRKALLLGEEVDVVEIMYERREKDWFGKTRYRQDRVRILLDNLCIREIPESYQ